MFCFKVIEKSGFVCNDLIIDITDLDGSMFYYKLNENRKNIFFNLPKGTYRTKNDLKQIEPIKYKLGSLPRPHNQSSLPDNFNISFGENPNKCTVNLDKGTVFFDNKFKDAERYTLDYIIFHELGHYFFYGKGQKSEIACDKFAANCMLILGYNPPQIRAAQFFTLSESKDAIKRKKEIFKLTKESYE